MRYIRMHIMMGPDIANGNNMTLLSLSNIDLEFSSLVTFHSIIFSFPVHHHGIYIIFSENGWVSVRGDRWLACITITILSARY